MTVVAVALGAVGVGVVVLAVLLVVVLRPARRLAGELGVLRSGLRADLAALSAMNPRRTRDEHPSTASAAADPSVPARRLGPT